MSVRISRALQSLKPSATIAMAGKARQLKDEGHTVYDLSLGEPDFLFRGKTTGSLGGRGLIEGDIHGNAHQGRASAPLP